jgi:hypothetical protein
MNPNVLFLTRKDCRDSRAMMDNAIKALNGISFQTIDVDKLPANDVRRGYGTPTILVQGRDLFGMHEPESLVAPQNRQYAIGIPTEEEIGSRLERAMLLF